MSIYSSPKTSDCSPCFQNIYNDIIEESDRNLIESISQLIEEKIQKNRKKKIKIKKDCFFSNTLPKISINEYLIRIVKYTKINISTLILSIASITSLMRKNKNAICYNNIYKLIITSCLLNSKFYEDSTHSSNFFAKVGGISIKELNYLEMEFYIKCNFSLFQSEENYNTFLNFFLEKSKKKNFNNIF